MPFHPTGPSIPISVSSQVPAVIALAGLPQTGRVVRLVAMTFPAKASCFVAFGTENVSVNSANGMPLDLDGKDQCVSLANETHMAIMMGGNSNYEIVATPGEIV